MEIAVLLSYLRKLLRLKPAVITSLEKGLMDPRGGGLDEIMTKILLFKPSDQSELSLLTIGEGKDYDSWNTMLIDFFVSMINIYFPSS